MSLSSTSKSAPIVIVGAGVFGLTTALHLAQRGYTNVKILDKQAYHETLYSYDSECDGASADMNKIIRAGYGSQIEYQDLALDAISTWKQWNEEIQSGTTLPPGFDTSSILYCNNGSLTMNTDADITQFDIDSIRNMNASGLEGTQFVITNAYDIERAKAQGFGFAVNPFHRKDNYGLLDTWGGFVYADRACRFVLHKVELLGVKLVLGGSQGTFSSFLRDHNSQVTGVLTQDGTVHPSALTIMACGGWTPALIPQLDNLCETTCGSISIFQLPQDSPLWERLAPGRFPTWTYKIRDGATGGLYGFPRDSAGRIKIGYRGTKYTNPQTQSDGAVRSEPITRWTRQSIRQLPQTAANVVKGFLEQHMPELLSCSVKTRLCWYTDSFDNHFVVDFVPGMEGLMVVTGGSGHGFKFLPNLGAHVVNRIEGKADDLLKLWKWRSLATGQKAHNSIMEGLQSERALQRQALTGDDSLNHGRSTL